MGRPKKEDSKKFLFFKYCNECGEKYKPSGRWVRYCEDCSYKRKIENSSRRKKDDKSCESGNKEDI